MLELIYTLVMPMTIRKFTKYKYFYPLKSGVKLFMNHVLDFSAVVIIIFPITILAMVFEPPAI